MDLQRSKTPKKPYDKPKLSLYGDLTAITVTSYGKSRNFDNATAHTKFSKTG